MTRMPTTRIPLDFSAVLAAFAQPSPLPVYDVTGRRDASGRWEEGFDDGTGWRKGAHGERSITAVVLALGPRDLALLAEGESMGGGIAVITREELYCPDQIIGGNGLETRQSYVFYQRQRYRVTGDGLLHGNANIRLYHALRSLR